MKNMTELTENDFEREVLQASVPVVVDFYAPWCGPCKMLAPLLETLAAEFEDRIKFAKLNVDHAPGLSGRYQVTGVPTLALFRNGQRVDSLVGLVSPKTLKAWLTGVAAATPQPAAV
jgi:thioredoxin